MRQRRNENAANPRWTRQAATLATALVALWVPASQAFEIDVGNPDIQLRWDNTIRYNLSTRVQGQDQALLKNVNIDDGNRNFERGRWFNRFDVLSEADIIYKRSFGARVSAALWWDPAYRTLDSTSPQTSNTLVNGLPAVALSPFTERYGEGPSAEFLDAFVFANFDAGTIPINIKAGQHTVYWGDSLLLGGAIHGVSYAQNSLDVWKGLATPGAEAKELFRPRGGLTIQAQPHQDLSLAVQWFYNWQAVRYPESGTYLSISDALNFGADSLILGANPFATAVPGSPALLRAWRGNLNTRQSTYGGSLNDFGLAARWSPEWLDGTLGFYYRNATDIQPQVTVTPGFAGLPAATCRAIGGTVVAPGACIINSSVTNAADLTRRGKAGEYNLTYGEDIHIIGVTLSKNIAGISVGAEINYRENMPLSSDPVQVLPAPLVPNTPGSIATTAFPSSGTPGALGNTLHGLVNAVGILPKTGVWDTASYQAELTWMQWLKVTQNEAVFKGRDSYTLVDRVSRNYWGLGLNFTPTWFQVFPGVDVLAPLSFSIGLSGNAAVSSGGNEGTGQFGAGVAFDIYSKYRVDLKYVGFFGDYSTNATGAAFVTNGPVAGLSDRGFVALTFKATF
jgi:hypothetical protein